MARVLLMSTTMIVSIANVINHEMLGDSDALRGGIIVFFISNEGLSIIENAIDLGVPFPESLKERFLSWRDKQLVSKNTPQDEED